MNRRSQRIKRVSHGSMVSSFQPTASRTKGQIFLPVRTQLNSMWIVGFLWCMNSTPLAWGSPTSKPAASQPAKTQKKVPIKQKVKVKVAGNVKAKKAPKGKAAKSKPSVQARCRNRPKYGQFCLGRVIGPSFSNQILRCPHCGKSVLVKKLGKPWKPNRFDSDLRPHFGHYPQKHRIWVCRHCGYSAYGKDFFKPYNKNQMSRSLRRIRRIFKTYKDIPAYYKFFSANASYVARKRDAAFFAELMLRALWSMREEKTTKYIKTFRRSAIAALRFAFKKKLVPTSIRHIRAFQIADLLRQQKQWSEATYWLERSYSLLEKGKKAKVKLQFHKQMQRWILQLQQKISKRKTDVFVLN